LATKARLSPLSVGHRAERDEIEEAEEIRLRPLGGPETPRAQLAIERNHRHEHQADGREMAEPREIVEPVGIDDGKRRRQLLVGLVMIDHDYVETELARLRERLVTGGAAIDRDQKRCTLRSERADRLRVRPVALEQAVGNVDKGMEPAMTQISPQRRRRRGAIDVVVAEDRDRLAARDGIGEPRRRVPHAGERVRVRHQRPHRRIEEACHRVHLDSAAGEDARQKLRHVVVPLRDRKRSRCGPLVQPVAPGAPASRAFHAEKEASRRADGRGQGNRHLQAALESVQNNFRYWMKPGRSANRS
jgi:hypothetical protein